MGHIGVQLYAVRTIDAPLSELVRIIGDTPAEGVEFADFAVPLAETDTDAVKRALDETGLEASGAMFRYGTPPDQLTTNLEECIEQYSPLGCENYLIPRFDETPFDSQAALDEKVAHLNAVANVASDHGVSLLYHNHTEEFATVNGELAFELLLESTDPELQFAFDVGWAGTAGYDPTRILNQYSDRIPVVHLKDMDVETGESTILGKGDVDIRACVDAAREGGADWLVYEHESPTNPRQALEQSIQYLSSL